MAQPSARLMMSPPHPCPYLPDRQAASLFCEAPDGCAADYERLQSARWRRSGLFLYQPRCPACAECRPIRLPVADFEPSCSQRKTHERNNDISLEIDTDIGADDAIALYCAYQRDWHGSSTPEDPDSAREFLGASPVDTLLMRYRLGDRLVGAGWVDVLPEGLSSVYFAFDRSEAKRRLGVHSLLCEINLARELGKSWLWMGFWVPGCQSMTYKADYRPHEVLEDGAWHRVAAKELSRPSPG